jgi:hypothetical protein
VLTQTNQEYLPTPGPIEVQEATAIIHKNETIVSLKKK